MKLKKNLEIYLKNYDDGSPINSEDYEYDEPAIIF